MILYCDLWETKEEADWHREFGCIKRTERLDLPTWEQFDNSYKIIEFTSKLGKKCRIDGSFHLDSQLGYITLTVDHKTIVDLRDYTKENYIKVCEKAKELFLGE